MGPSKPEPGLRSENLGYQLNTRLNDSGGPLMRVARSDGLSADPMQPKMQAAYRALENANTQLPIRHSPNPPVKYVTCGSFHTVSPGGTRAYGPELRYWMAYAQAGQAAAKFGDGKITDGLKLAKDAASSFSALINGAAPVEAASESLRRSGRDGLACVRSLESAQRPLLPKIWLDWKAAHPPSTGPSVGSTPPARASSVTVATIDAPGATATFAHGINNAGQIVGSFRALAIAFNGYVATPTR